MAVKSIIEVDVKDDSFKAFKSLYDEYQKALAEAPDAWKTANDEMGQAVEVSELLRNDAQTRLALLQEETLEQQKKDALVKKEEDKQKKALADRKKSDDETHKRWKSLGDTIKQTTGYLLKFGGISLGLATGVTTFGMGKLANDASQTRFQSMGLGISSGAMQSANINYAKLLGSPDQSLSAIRESQTDVSQAWKFSALGIQGQEGKKASELLPEVLTKIRDTLKAVPQSQRENIAKAYSMDSFTSAEDRQRMMTMSDAEFAAENKRYQQDLKDLNIRDSALKSFQDLDSQFDRTGKAMFKAFVEGLEPLAPALTRFSEAVGGAFEKLMMSGKLEPLIDKLADGITRFSAYLTSKEAEKDFNDLKKWVSDAADSVEKFADKIHSGLAMLGFIESNDKDKQAMPLITKAKELGSHLPFNPLNPLGTAYSAYKGVGGIHGIMGGVSKINDFIGDKDSITAQKQIATYTANSEKAIKAQGKPLSAEEYKKAESDRQGGFVDALGNKFKDVMTEVWTKTQEVAGGAVDSASTAINDTIDSFTGGGDKEKTNYAIASFEKMGYSRAQAAGIASNLFEESGFNPSIKGDGGKAYGIGQWHPDRQANFKKAMGKDIHGSSLEEQLKFVDWELKNTEKGAGSRLSGVSNAGDAAAVISKYYERPAAREEAARNRAARANKMYASYNGAFSDVNNISHSDYKGTPFVTKKDANGNQITVKKDYQNPQSQSVMFQKSQGGYDMQQGRTMRLEINNSTGGSAITSASTL